MPGDYWAMVGRAVDAIERDIKLKLTLDSISKGVGLSKFHLHRLFKALTGRSLMAYVRGRKLSRSLNDLLNSELKIIDIANEYGFEYEQTYERAFKQLFSISPSAFRRDRPQLPVVQLPSMADLEPIGQGVVIKPAFVLKPQFHLMGMEHEIVHEQNYNELTASKLAVDFYFNHARSVPNAIHRHVYYGLIRYSSNTQYSNFYMPSVEVSEIDALYQTYKGITVPGHVYAVFRYVGFHAAELISIRTLGELYRYINDQWFPQAGFRRADGYHFERIDMKRCTNEYCEAEIYMPVEG